MIFSVLEMRAAEGCQIGNQIYTVPNGTISVTIIVTAVTVGNYLAPTIPTLPPACPRATNIRPVPALINTCVINGSLLTAGLGNIVTYDRLDPPIGCSFDDYSWALGVSASAAGFIFIRKRRRT